MGKVQTSAGIGAIKGKVGGMTFYIRNGQQEMQPSKRSSYNDKRSPEQMTARIKTGNVLNLYRLIKGFLDDCFEGVIGGKTKNSFFRKYNYVLRPVMLERRQSGVWQCVLAPYIVSNGKIPEIEYEYKEGMFVSNINIGDLVITDDTEIGDIASATIKNNEFWQNEDCLKIMLLRQKMSDDIRELYMPTSTAVNLSLEKYSRKRLGDAELLDTEYKGQRIEFCNKDGYLAVKAQGDYVFACAFIHSRDTKQTLSVSTQKLCLSNTTLYDYYTGEEATIASWTSYKTCGYRNNPKDKVYLQGK